MSVHDGHGWCFIGKAPDFFFFSYGAWELSSPDSFGGGAWDRPVGGWRTDFHGSLDIEVF